MRCIVKLKIILRMEIGEALAQFAEVVIGFVSFLTGYFLKKLKDKIIK